MRMRSARKPVGLWYTIRASQETWQMEVEINRLLEESPADPRRHLDQDRVRRYAEVLGAASDRV
jgi:hypothetical protein